jgi:hypothetical protein
MKLTKMKISVLGIAAACLVLIFINGTVVSETETFTDSNQPAADIEPVVPIVVQPERPISEDAFGEMRPRRGPGGARPEGGQQRGGFGIRVSVVEIGYAAGPVTVPAIRMHRRNRATLTILRCVRLAKACRMDSQARDSVNDESCNARDDYSPKTETHSPKPVAAGDGAAGSRIIVEQWIIALCCVP